MDKIWSFICDNWQTIFAVAGFLLTADGLAGILPDKWIPYIGALRRIAPKIAAIIKTRGAKGAIIALTAGISFYGCSILGIETPPSVCDDAAPGESLLCDLAHKFDIHLETAGDIIVFAELDAIDRGIYKESEADKFLRNLQALVNAPGVTGMDIALFVRSKISNQRKAALIGMTVSRYIGYLDTPELLRQDDVRMLNYWIDQQLAMLVD